MVKYTVGKNLKYVFTKLLMYIIIKYLQTGKQLHNAIENSGPDDALY